MAQKDFISKYNHFSGYLWLAIAAVSFVVITFKIFSEGAQTWWPYYIIPLMALLTYGLKKWMMQRMQKHLKEMAEERESSKQ